MIPMNVIIFGASMIAFALVLRFFIRASEAKFKQRLASTLNDPEIRWEKKGTAFQYRDLHFSYRKYDGGRHKSSASFSVSVECPGTGGEFEIRGEGGIERHCKDVGVIREVQTPEEEFNRRFYIASDTPGFAQSYFLSSEKREAVKRLFDAKASTVSHKGQRLTVTWSGSASHEEGVIALKSTIEALAILAKEMPLCSDAVSLGVLGGCAFIRALMTGLAVGSLAAGLVSVIWASKAYPVFDAWELFFFTLRFSLPALAIFLYFTVTTLIGTSRAHRDILLIGVLSLAGFLMLGCGLTGLYNGMKDPSAPESHAVLIIDKQYHRSKKSTTYELIVQSWRPGRARETITTSSSVYNKAVPGRQKAVIYTQPGKLGFEWLVHYHLSQ